MAGTSFSRLGAAALLVAIVVVGVMAKMLRQLKSTRVVVGACEQRKLEMAKETRDCVAREEAAQTSIASQKRDYAEAEKKIARLEAGAEVFGNLKVELKGGDYQLAFEAVNPTQLPQPLRYWVSCYRRSEALYSTRAELGVVPAASNDTLRASVRRPAECSNGVTVIRVASGTNSSWARVFY